MMGVVVVDRLTDWPIRVPDVEVVTAWTYLNDDAFVKPRRARVYNLCRSFSYQSIGYYVSLLASARGHAALPDVTTIQDLKLADSPRIVNDEVDDLINQSLAKLGSEHYTLNIYFSRCMAKRHERLARALFNLFPAPLLQVAFVHREGNWRVDAVAALALGEVPEGHLEFLLEAASDYFLRKRAPRIKRESARYDLAILVNPKEAEPPSNAQALKRFEKAAVDLGFDVEFLDKGDYGHVAEFDALFIRETTAVNHHTYRFARRAAREGLVVLDDPLSILRAANKVFLAQVMTRQRIPQPETLIVHRGNVSQIARDLGFPCVLKQPDSQFSKGVIKVESEAELKRQTRAMLERSDLIIAQRFTPTEYDWRIGVLDGVAIYACRYFMAKDHWQIIRRDDAGEKDEGAHETLAIADVPPNVLSIAVQAAKTVGQGLYGVDLKQFGSAVTVIEVNDNPNIDFGIEDLVLKDALYQRVMGYFIKRLEARTRSG